MYPQDHDGPHKDFDLDDTTKMGLLDYLAFSQMTLVAQGNGVKGTCWLVTSDEVKAAERKKILDSFNGGLIEASILIVPMDETTFEKVIQSLVPARQFASWQQSCLRWQELEQKWAAERETGNPAAFFVG